MTSARDIDDLPRTPQTHFRLHVYGSVLQLRGRLPAPDAANGLGFLNGYYQQLDAAGAGAAGDAAERRWARLVAEWEAGCTGHLPLRALRDACGLDPAAVRLLFTAGLVEEDGRFGGVFEALNGAPGAVWPTLGAVGGWSPEGAAREALAQLLDAGVLAPGPPELPRTNWPLRVHAPVWDALRHRVRRRPADGMRLRPADELAPQRALMLEPEVRLAIERMPGMCATGARPVIVRGQGGSGRRAVAAAIARELGRGLLEVEDPRTPLVGPLATLLDAVPVFELAPGPGEVLPLPEIHGYTGPVVTVVGRSGGVQAASGMVAIETAIPSSEARGELWRRALGSAPPDGLARLRIPSGSICRAAARAADEAALAGRAATTLTDVERALRAERREALEALAKPVPVAGGWADLVVDDESGREIELLELRCRHREALRDAAGKGPCAGAGATVGVRALLSGPSGTGKTLCARLLASVLGRDLYAVDLSTVVNKYLGETEKNLEAILSRAEEHDVVLLFDEGDALLTRRTEVSTSNDRYANLETNFLLQRLERFEGILLVTTNASERIDGAFKRRMDVVIGFRAPGAEARRRLWDLHLTGDQAVSDGFLDEVAARCALTGGQIRNAALHVALLSLGRAGGADDDCVAEAVRREYRKAGQVCPLRTLERPVG